MSDLVLLGAGASVDAGLPASFALTSEISKATALPEQGKSHGAPELAKLLAFAIGTLYQQRGAAGINPLTNPQIDIEELVDAIDSLAHPETSGMTPFISGWHPFLRDIDAANDDRNQMVQHFLESFAKANAATSSENKRQALEDASMYLRMSLLLTQPKFASVLFRRLKDSIVLRTSQLLWIPATDPSRTSYLLPLLNSGASQCVATLNYDNTVERCSEANKVKISLGLEEYASRGEVNFDPDAQIRLLKLHGSLDWSISIAESHTPYAGKEALNFNWRQVPPTHENWNVKDLGIVFGRWKMQAPGPFLDLLYRLRLELQTTDRLVAIGYSFRDDHINRTIVQFLMKRSSNRLLIINPDLPHEYRIAVDLVKAFPGRIRFENATAKQALGAYPFVDS